MELVPYLLDSPLPEDSGMHEEKIRVRICQNAWQAKIACKCIKQKDVALTLFKTIYLSHSTATHFLANQKWVAHELAHVRQFMTYGKLKFLFMYLIESLRKGYYQNKWECEARAQEQKAEILQDFYFEYQI